ncbi:GNAT family N-acetyltransferase [Rheinheimera fenheensis]|uniref:GNAT family N-acetyltransferase n=1 Tax=Rheinheimera fenheensis TaxID=3152295 RepID=UPI0032602583
MTNWLNDVVLTGKTVTLLPMKPEHASALADASADGQLSMLWFTSVPDTNSVRAYIEEALWAKEQGTALPFVVWHNALGKIIGTTRFCCAEAKHKRLEIGYTWYAKSFQQTAVNTECKFLLLSYAFEQLKAIAVEFRTHWHNHASRAAIARLGAKQDGVLRNHRKSQDGLYRDTVIFSIIDLEWFTVKQALSHKLSCYQ